MPEFKTYSIDQIPFRPEEVPLRPEPRKVLMCAPDFFDIVDEKNVHMQGQIGHLDKQLAIRQWQSLLEVYQQWEKNGILEQVTVIPGVEGLEDMVFTANQSFPYIVDGKYTVVMSRMRHPSRQREVPYFRTFFKSIGYRIIDLSESVFFEGMGDLIPHYGRHLLYGGYGHRTDPGAYDEIARSLKVPIVLLPLEDPRFYHLDTCFIPADEHTVFLTTAAFSKTTLHGIKKLFTHVVEIPEEEAAGLFALNAHLVNDKKSGKKAAVLQQGTVVMKQKLAALGFEVWEVNTSEFIKSGGSCFCLKMMYY
ncbi:MAG: amidinotransferase [Chitinophagales bacterium]|nr:MAG: amidinotransferase [Chitinophagales bacterium]